jgi:Mn2+/Fe2+ NRAMP family transporter
MNAIVSAIAIFVVGVSIMYFDLGIRPPEYGTPLTLHLLVSTQTQLLMITLPVPAGYVAGVLVSLKKYPHAVFIFLTVSLAGAIGGTEISLAGGSAPGFTELLFFVSTFVVMVFALFSVIVMSWGDSKRPTDT